MIDSGYRAPNLNAHLSIEEELESSHADTYPKDQPRHSDTGAESHHSGYGNQESPRTNRHRSTAVGENMEIRASNGSKCGMWSKLKSLCQKALVRLLENASPGPANPCQVTSCAVSFKGANRRKNEDSWYVSPDKSVFVVADGMTGAPAGEIASQLTAETLAEELAIPTSLRSKRMALAVLNHAFEQANSRVVEFGRTHDCAGLAAAVVTAIRRENRICIAGVGDCRAYLYRGERLKQLTCDDTLSASLLKQRQVTPEYFNVNAFRNILVRRIGSDPFRPTDEASIVELRPGDRLILCSDGLVDAVDELVIESVLAISDDPHEATNRLRYFAKAASAHDDATCVVIFADCNDYAMESGESHSLRSTVPSTKRVPLPAVHCLRVSQEATKEVE